jgi:hypothetical protein
LAATAAEILKQLPRVVAVEVRVPATEPTHRIVHLRDYHFVPRDLYAVEVRDEFGRGVSEKDVDDLHRGLVLRAEVVQAEQLALLRCFVRHHGLKRVLAEGLTPSGVKNYEAIVEEFREMDRQLAPLMREFGRYRGKNPDIDYKIRLMTRERDGRLAEYRAAARLAVAGEPEILPLDDDELLEAAKPVTPDGRVRADPRKVEARHDSQVRAALASGPCAFVILGGDHDLSASVRRLGGGSAEYLRVTTRAYREFDRSEE